MTVIKNQSSIRCEECTKEDVCKYTDEYKKKLEQYSVDSNSPIYVTVGCRSAVKKPMTTTRTFSDIVGERSSSTDWYEATR